MEDLLVITPSRGRPERLREMITACWSLSEAGTEIAVAYDDDDPCADAYAELLKFSDVRAYHGPRNTLTGWTNLIAADQAGNYRALASFGDDHLPRTPGWDGLLLEALDQLNDTGTGIAYGDDLHQGERLPTAPVVSSDIVTRLGWMCLPLLAHMHVDDVWRDLGRAAGCLVYVPGVVVEHCHPDAGKAVSDQVYAESMHGLSSDQAGYARWRRDRMDIDVRRVRALVQGRLV